MVMLAVFPERSQVSNRAKLDTSFGPWAFLAFGVVPVPGIQDGPGVRVGGRGVAHVGDVNGGNFLALVGPAHKDVVGGH